MPTIQKIQNTVEILQVQSEDEVVVVAVVSRRADKSEAEFIRRSRGVNACPVA